MACREHISFGRSLDIEKLFLLISGYYNCTFKKRLVFAPEIYELIRVQDVHGDGNLTPEYYLNKYLF